MVRVEDLMRWSCAQPSRWSSCAKAASCGTNGVHRPLQSEDSASSSEPLRGKTQSEKRLFQPQFRSRPDVNRLSFCQVTWWGPMG